MARVTRSCRASVSPASGFDPHGQARLRALSDGPRLTIVGWAIGRSCAVKDVEIVAGEKLLAAAPVELERPDVAEVHDLPGAGTSGFQIILEADGTGTGELLVRAVLEDGSRFALATVRAEAVAGPAAESGSWTATGSRRDPDRPLAWTVLFPPKEREKVLVGKDEWLFLCRDNNDTIGQLTGAVRLGHERRRGWQRLLEQRVELVERLGLTWQCLVVPGKEAVYPELLPAHLTPATRRPIHEFLDVARQAGAPVVYPLDDLLVEKAKAPLFPRTDTHWSQRGAYVAYRALCGALRDRGVALTEPDGGSIEWLEVSVRGDLGEKLYPPRASMDVSARLSSAHHGTLVFDNRVDNHGRVMVVERPGSSGPVGVVFGESFTHNMLIFLKESFRRLVFVHTSMMIAEVLEHERPDVVLSMPIERFLMRVPDDSNGFERLAAEVRRKTELERFRSEEEPRLRGMPVAARDVFHPGALPWPVATVGTPSPLMPGRRAAAVEAEAAR